MPRETRSYEIQNGEIAELAAASVLAALFFSLGTTFLSFAWQTPPEGQINALIGTTIYPTTSVFGGLSALFYVMGVAVAIWGNRVVRRIKRESGEPGILTRTLTWWRTTGR